MPFFNHLAEKEIAIPFTSPVFWLSLLASGMLLGLATGGYPALFMSRFIPSRVLKRNRESVGGARVRNALVAFQFAVSLFLIVSALVVYKQVIGAVTSLETVSYQRYQDGAGESGG